MATTYSPGRYSATILDQGFQQSAAGNTMVVLHFRLEGCYGSDGSLVPCPHYERTYSRAVTEKTKDYVRADIRTLGVEVPPWHVLDPQSPDAVRLIGRRVDVHCTHEEYRGQPTERWSLRPMMRPRSTADEIRRLDQLGGASARPDQATKPASESGSTPS